MHYDFERVVRLLGGGEVIRAHVRSIRELNDLVERDLPRASPDSGLTWINLLMTSSCTRWHTPASGCFVGAVRSEAERPIGLSQSN